MPSFRPMFVGDDSGVSPTKASICVRCKII